MNHPILESRTARTVTIEGEELVAFAGCDYLGLSVDSRVLDAAASSSRSTGLSSTASRETSGSFATHERLEAGLAEFLGTESALLAVDGYAADLALLQGLSDRLEIAIIDADAHASLFDATKISSLDSMDYGAGDLNRAHAMIDRNRERGMVVLTDGVFPMQGRLAASNMLLRVLPDTDAWLVIDDSHALGVLGNSGRGSLEIYGLEDPRVVITGSLGKALGTPAGFIAGSHEVLSRIRRRSDVHVGSSAPSPAIAAAGLTALDLLQAEPDRVQRLPVNTRRLHQIGRRLGRTLRGSYLPVLPLAIEDDDAGRRAHAGLRGRGIFAPFVRYPGDASSGVLRLAVTSEHTEEDLSLLESALLEVL